MQTAPVVLDRAATVALVVDEVTRAAASGAQLVAFPESFVPGYPDWVWRQAPMSDAGWYQRFLEEAVDLEAGHLDDVAASARENGVWVALAVTERARSGTLYNSVVYLDPDGHVAARHRKLMPTGAERLVWGMGQDHLLAVVEIDGTRVASLICWELYMPLARMALYEQGVDVLLAPTWDNSEEWVPTLRHVAKEGRLFVVGVTACINGADMPRDLPGADELYEGADDWLSRGNSTIVGPGGEVLAGPLIGERGVVCATLDIDEVARSRQMFDPTGHYSRPDVVALVRRDRS